MQSNIFFVKKKIKLKNLFPKNKLNIDFTNLNDYYDTEIKKNRLKILKKEKNFLFFKDDLNNKNFYKKYKKHLIDIDIVIHMAGQAGVRYSILNPETYIMNNILAYVKLLEFFKQSRKLKVILYASSSSVYGEKGQKKL